MMQRVPKKQRNQKTAPTHRAIIIMRSQGFSIFFLFFAFSLVRPKVRVRVRVSFEVKIRVMVMVQRKFSEDRNMSAD